MTSGWTRTDGVLDIEDVRDHFDEIEDPTIYSIPGLGITDDLTALRDALSSPAKERTTANERK
jgi:hypothetical protein